MENNKENFLLKKIRHYQGNVADYAAYWEQRIAEDNPKLSSDTKALKKKNDDLNKDFIIRPVERD